MGGRDREGGEGRDGEGRGEEGGKGRDRPAHFLVASAAYGSCCCCCGPEMSIDCSASRSSIAGSATLSVAVEG